MDRRLTAAELRVLGSMIEKEFVTPDNYPLTLNALRVACNQKSSREPVVSFDEATVLEALESLRELGLAWEIESPENRVLKYKHSFDRAFRLDKDDMAILCVLMLRGPQTQGELKTRTARMREFDALSEIMKILERLSIREEGALVERLPRQPGQKEARYRHLLLDPRAASMPSEIVNEANEDPESDWEAPRPTTFAERDRLESLEAELADLRGEVRELRNMLESFRRQFE
jgi:uncharacterized protein YceH (UPF0502 family)